MRPRGEIGQALVSAAREPMTVRALCERAQVGYEVGRYTATRLVQRGELVRFNGHVGAHGPQDATARPGPAPVQVVARDALPAAAGLPWWHTPPPFFDAAWGATTAPGTPATWEEL